MKVAFGRTLALTLCMSIYLLLSAVKLLADESGDQNHIALGSRVFDLGVDPDTLDRGPEPTFIPLNRAKWLNEIISSDPALQGAVVHIDRLFRRTDDMWTFPGPANFFAISNHIPDRLQIAGYAVQAHSSTMRNLLYIPYQSELKFSVRCTTIRDGSVTKNRFNLCVLASQYPPDSYLFVKARLYFPDDNSDLGTRFKLVAQKIQDIAYCLDVTDDLTGAPKSLLEGHGEGSSIAIDPKQCRGDLTS